jgi:hypothetical protein
MKISNRTPPIEYPEIAPETEKPVIFYNYSKIAVKSVIVGICYT